MLLIQQEIKRDLLFNDKAKSTSFHFQELSTHCTRSKCLHFPLPFLFLILTQMLVSYLLDAPIITIYWKIIIKMIIITLIIIIISATKSKGSEGKLKITTLWKEFYAYHICDGYENRLISVS